MDYVTLREDIRQYIASRPKGTGLHLFYGTEAEIHAAREALAREGTSNLPKGISGGKIAAALAVVTLAAGSLYAITRKPKEAPVGQWTDRVAAEQDNLGPRR